jgi:Membrane carboxypeptidase/penicillin-binding protein
MTPETVLWDVPTRFPTGTGDWYAPQNYNGQWNGPVRIRTALANSLNMPAVRALKFAGIDYTLRLLERVGIRNGLKRGANFYGLSLTLGGGEVSPLELTTAYNTLASGGRYFAPVAILEITDGGGTDTRTGGPKPTVKKL